jgi:hypothetical protein
VRAPFERRDLVSQRQIFHSQFVLRSEQGQWVDHNHPEKFKHAATACSQVTANQAFRFLTEFLPPSAMALFPDSDQRIEHIMPMLNSRDYCTDAA